MYNKTANRLQNLENKEIKCTYHLTFGLQTKTWNFEMNSAYFPVLVATP